MAAHELSLDGAERVAAAYRHEVLRRPYSDSTIAAYGLGIRLMLAFARRRGVLDRETIKLWQDDLSTRVSPRTTALYGMGVRRMLEWAADNGECDSTLVRAVRKGTYDRLGTPRPLRPEHLATLEAYLRDRPQESLGVRELRDRALFYYVRATAARIGEVLQVRRATFESETVRQTQRSGGEKTLVPPPGVVGLIRAYLAARTDDLEWLWIGVQTTGDVTLLTEDAVLRVWQRMARNAGVPTFTTFQLRHTAGALLAEQGRDHEDIMVHLGGRDVRAVQGYRVLVSRHRIEEIRAGLDFVPS